MARRPQQAVQLADPAQADQISAADELSEWQGDGQFMQSLARGLLVLREVVKGRGKVVPPREIAETTGLSIQSVRRCIYTMNATGHVRANRNGAVPGLALSELAGEFFASSPLVAACGPILDKLHDEQEWVEWTTEALDRDRRWERFAALGMLVSVVLVGVLIALWWFL